MMAHISYHSEGKARAANVTPLHYEEPSRDHCTPLKTTIKYLPTFHPKDGFRLPLQLHSSRLTSLVNEDNIQIHLHAEPGIGLICLVVRVAEAWG